MSDQTTKKFSTGMQRSAAVEHLKFTSIHPVFMVALARTLAEGADKYSDGNWELGCDVVDNLNHVMGHINGYLSGDRSEPHLAHAACGLMFAIVNDTLHPELSEPFLRGPGCTMTDARKSRMDAERPDKEKRRAAGEFETLGKWKLSEVPEIKAILNSRKAVDREP